MFYFDDELDMDPDMGGEEDVEDTDDDMGDDDEE